MHLKYLSVCVRGGGVGITINRRGPGYSAILIHTGKLHARLSAPVYFVLTPARETSPASTSGPTVTRYQPLGSNWSRSAPASASRKRRMEQGDSSESTNKARTARRLNLLTNRLPSFRRPNSSSHPLRGRCLTCAERTAAAASRQAHPARSARCSRLPVDHGGMRAFASGRSFCRPMSRYASMPAGTRCAHRCET